MKALNTRELGRTYKLLSPQDQQEVTAMIEAKIREVEEKKTDMDARKTHLAKGRIFFANPNARGKRKPIHHLDVELWDKDISNPDDFLGGGVTDMKGRFEIWYNPADAGYMDVPDLEIRLFERKYRIDHKGNLSFTKNRITTVFGENNVKTLSFDFGSIEIPYWEYHPEKPMPRVHIAEEGGPPQSYSAGRSLEMIKALASIEAIKRKHVFLAKNDPRALNCDKVQRDYPINLTRKIEKDRPGYTRSDEYFAELFLNGMEASVMDRDPDHPEIFWIHHHWNSYEQDGIYAMPNVDIKFKKSGTSILPIEITLGMRKPGKTKPNAKLEFQTFTPKDKAKWPQAKRVARVSAALVAELDSHLCTTHLNVEQYAIAAYRNIRRNPIRHLLFPHIKEVALINHSADTLLLGENGYITKATGFVESSIEERLVQVLGTLDWKNWTPREKVCEDHRYADAAWLFWNMLGEFVDDFFSKYEEGIVQFWHEIKIFSEEVVDNSVPVFLCNYLQGKLATPKNATWFDWNERMDTSVKRTESNGFFRAVSPITIKKTPGDRDIDNLKQVARYVIYHSTFAHWWSNNRQYDEGGELKFTALGMRYGKKGILTTENDLSVLPPPREATMQLWISYMLSYTRFGLIMKNEDKDLHPILIEKLQELDEPFRELDLDISTMPSRTNI